jgi:hypothetical protein
MYLFGTSWYIYIYIYIHINKQHKHLSKPLIYDMIYIYIYLTAIGLTPGGSNTAHIYIQTVHRIH